MRKLLLFTSILLLTGCSADWHLRKALKKNPALLTKSVVTVHDTIVVPPVVVTDTVVAKDGDTVVVEKDRFHVKIVRVKDQLMIEGGCKTDTIFRTVEVPIEQVVYKEKNSFFDLLAKYTFFVLLLLFLLRGLGWLARKYANKYF